LVGAKDDFKNAIEACPCFADVYQQALKFDSVISVLESDADFFQLFDATKLFCDLSANLTHTSCQVRRLVLLNFFEEVPMLF